MKPNLLYLILMLAVPTFGNIPTISPELGEMLEKVQVALDEEQWDEAVAALNTFAGEKNAVWYNALGQVYMAQDKWPEAEVALREAYKRNADQSFGLALAVCLMERNKNGEALQLFGKHIDFSNCDQGALESYLSLASQSGDTRLVQEITRWGLIRFPDSRYIREMDIRLAVEAEDDVALLRATEAMLIKEPLEIRWWQSRAAGSKDRSDLQLARLEAAVLADPENMEMRRMHLSAQLAAGHYGEALAQAGVLMQHAPDQSVALYCVQAAVMAEDFETAFQWLKKTDASDDADYWRVVAVVALENHDFEKADEALSAMLHFPEPNPSLWRWAARAAVDAESPLAEKWLMQGLTLDPEYKTAMALDYARWLIREARMDEAAHTLQVYLGRHSADPTALALLKLTQD
ncbi:hypothetical protein P9H32_05845 [Pontiella sp. NLcol2]|uniref:Tetratricopeptide repeat protein n=2 Tax=Pontiella agarivorans TaxID=3038953 RepID=A0ABU5MVF4_9BACT|nr:hypothetical protein [Pontiella agarivorans]